MMKAASLILIVFWVTSAYAQKDSIYTSIASGLKNPDKVYKLDLSSRYLTILPVQVREFKHLRALYII